MHGDLRDQMSDMEWSSLEDHIITMGTPLQDHFSEASTSRLLRVPDNELPERPVDIGLRTPHSKTPPHPSQRVLTHAVAESNKLNNEMYLVETAFPIVQSSTPIKAAADTAVDAGTINVSTEKKQRVLGQPVPSAWLGDTTMETNLPFWLLPKSRYLKLHVPQSWASFCLPPDWPTDVGSIHDVFVDLFRPARNHRILLRIEVDRACVSMVISGVCCSPC